MAKKSKKNPVLLNFMNELFADKGKKLAMGGVMGPDDILPIQRDFTKKVNVGLIDGNYGQNNVLNDRKMDFDFNGFEMIGGNYGQDVSVNDQVIDDRFRLENTAQPATVPAKGKKANRQADYILPVLAAADYIIPTERPDRQNVIRPTRTFDNKLYGRGSQAIMAAGGSMGGDETPKTVAPKGYKRRTLEQRQAWNALLDYAAQKGYAGKPELDDRNQNMSRSVIEEFNKINPKMAINPDDVQHYQYELRAINEGTFPQLVTSKPEYADIWSKRMYSDKYNKAFIEKPRSQVDNWFGSLTSQQYYPQYEFVSDKKKVNYGVDYDKYAEAMYNEQQKMAGIAKMENGGSIKKIGHNEHDGGTFEFNGPSHKNGGIDISYGGNTAEVEGQETAAIDSRGNLNIFGNMIVPGTKKKFKTVAKDFGKMEAKVSKTMEKGLELFETADPDDMYERLKFNSGMVKVKGAEIKKKQIAESKELLAALQDEMLLMANINGLEPKAMSEGKEVKAKYGAKMTFEDGGKPPSVAKRHNNPGNIKFGDFAKKFGAVRGEKSTDGGYFAKFPNTQKGLQAIRALLVGPNYANLSIDAAIKKWTNNTPYKIDISKFKGKTVGELENNDLQDLINIITQGEDNVVYGPSAAGSAAPQVPTQSGEPKPLPVTSPLATAPKVDEKNRTFTRNTPDFGKGVKPTPYDPVIHNTDKDMSSAADYNPLKIAQIAPELGVIATNRLRPVPAQRYEPELYNPYQVSFQDMRNENTASFNAMQSTLAANPAALGTLAAQKYMADTKVGAEEFRTNQGIENDIINKNVGLRNDAQFKNLGIADTQMTRQEQARSNTKRDLFTALGSIASKTLQNDLENIKTITNEALHDFRYKRDEKGRIVGFGYEGEDPQFAFNNVPNQPNNAGTTVKTVQDAQGNIKSVTSITDSQNKQDLDRQKSQLFRLSNFDLFGRQSRGRRGF